MKPGRCCCSKTPPSSRCFVVIRQAEKAVKIDLFEPLPLKAKGALCHRRDSGRSQQRSDDCGAQDAAYLHENPQPEKLIGAARQLVFVKGRNSHDYKFSSAVLEDYYHVSPPWRDRYLAASSLQFVRLGRAGQRSGETNASGAAGLISEEPSCRVATP